MQILLTENVDKVGRKGELVTVAEGYGRNFILKKKLEAALDTVAYQEVEMRRLERLQLY